MGFEGRKIDLEVLDLRGQNFGGSVSSKVRFVGCCVSLLIQDEISDLVNLI